MIIHLLWFAFRLYLWLIDSQQRFCNNFGATRCDLLSDCIFDLLIHSRELLHQIYEPVVICFQIVSLTYWFTAKPIKNAFIIMLWFAFRLYLWLIDSQHIIQQWVEKHVVICFQIVSLTYWFTARQWLLFRSLPLWFAFRLYLWLIDSQLVPPFGSSPVCCDLLSDCIFDLLIHS